MKVEEIRPGYVIELPKLGKRTVSRVDEFEDDTLVVVYFQHGEESYENRASAVRGGRQNHRLVERGLRPLRKGELVPAMHGNPLEAERLRARLEREITDRMEHILDRAAA